MTSANGRFEYEVTGNNGKPTLVFVHGWPDDARLWRKQLAALAPGFRCVTVTLPNFGARRLSHERSPTWASWTAMKSLAG